MGRVADVTVEVLEPYVGAMVAGMCARIGTDAVGKDLEHPRGSEFDTYLEAVGRTLAPVAPKSSVDTWLAEIQRRSLL